MINLLPPEIKETFAYARRNLILLRWVMAFFVGIVGIGGVILAGQLSISQSAKTYATDVENKKDDLTQQKMAETQKRTEDISSSTKLALQVLSRQVLFSELLRQIGAAMPAGAALQSLSLDKLEGGIDLQVVAVDYETATQVQINLEDPNNKIFEKADILNIACNSPDSNDQTLRRYPCQVTVRALFSKDSRFIFTNTSNETGTTR